MEPFKETRVTTSSLEEEKGLAKTVTVKADKVLSALAHLAPLAGILIPLGSILLPLGVLLLSRKRDLVRTHAKESLSTQISYTAYGLIPLFFLLAAQRAESKFLFGLAALLGILLSGLILWNMVAAIRAALQEEKYTYRLVFRPIR